MEYRMYVLFLRHLSGINKACQGMHVCMEYGYLYHNMSDYKKYISEDKTLISLDGGTSNDLEEIKKTLERIKYNHNSFYEPDINNCITSICFLVDERVWNKEKYQTEEEFYQSNPEYGINKMYDEWSDYIGEKNITIMEILNGKKLSI